MYETILVATDGSAHAERAARHAVSLAESFDATVTVLGVADLQRAAGAFSAGGIDDEFRERVRAGSESAVEDAAALADDRVPVETAVVDGDPAEAIVDYADDEEFDAVAMGTHGRRGLSRLVFGSVARYVVRHTTRPVLTARETDGDPVTDYDDVLVPTDGSDATEAAVDHGLAIADAFGATVHAVNIVDLSGMAAGSGVEPPTQQLERYTEAGEAAVDAVAERAHEAGLDAVTSVEHGFPAADLLGYVDEAGVDLVAMGTHGRTGIDRVLLGSTTERILSQSPVPVVAVHPDDTE
ncbi:universal stress protein UspA-like protein [Halosimplex carlsbadense 2-9-1]|uniref:Universal stress protein UspA-like protein n=1 Tax=Halosimplex carlsbadense 2-9-1 TaxID=797114 RepID=M0CGF9_9EURY|nr:universal stress protein [Halosimplex carlsbadense]ELZ22365.1 universal stress protein UspA-like protein [Halosimplex carlsbadense 2-9-1]